MYVIMNKWIYSFSKDHSPKEHRTPRTCQTSNTDESERIGQRLPRPSSDSNSHMRPSTSTSNGVMLNIPTTKTKTG